MKRVIDDKKAAVAILQELFGKQGKIKAYLLYDCIEKLYAPLPEWYETIDIHNDQTWILCYVSRSDSTRRDSIVWVCGVLGQQACPFQIATEHPDRQENTYMYATPVDLNLRYKREER